MRFEFYHEGLAGVPKISVDGTVDNAVHLSHWKGNDTPIELRADTSTEIALNFVASPRRDEFAQGIELVTNNHFDTDGVLSVWTALAGQRALDLRDPLVAAAEAGDFYEYPGRQAVRASIVIQGADSPDAHGVASPLALLLAGSQTIDEARAYELILPQVERVMTRTDEYEPLWRDAWARIEQAMESFAGGRSSVVEDAASRLSLVTLAPDICRPNDIDPTRLATPFTAIAHHARGEKFLIASPLRGGWSYRVDYPYYSWAVTVVRPRIARRNFTPIVETLNVLEAGNVGQWKLDESELASAVKFAGADGAPIASRLEPDAVAAVVRDWLLKQGTTL